MPTINHIVIKDGQARIAGKAHFKAEMIARMYTDGDYSIEAVMAHYSLTAAEVHAALAFYYDNQTHLDAEYAQTLAEIRANAMTLDKFTQKIAGNAQDHNTD